VKCGAIPPPPSSLETRLDTNLVPRSLFRSLHKSLETAKTIRKILVDDLIFENVQFYSIEKLNYIEPKLSQL
jgi:hypothetical protein